MMPFPGLRPFEEDESYLFFGRQTNIDELLKRLSRNRFVAVIGTSGSGKSSLVRAGLLPALHGGFLSSAGSHWNIAVFRPGEDPIGNLGSALDPVLKLGANLNVTLRRSSLGLVEAVRQANFDEAENVLVVVDQFEELFRYQKATGSLSDDASVFVKLLLEASQSTGTPVYILITMRSDFIGECDLFRNLPEAVNEGLYLVPRMARDQFRQAIVGPVAVGEGKISPGLVQRLLNDVGEAQDQLPVLQHALLRTWERAGGNLDIADYEAIGGMAEALSRHADEAYSELSDESSRVAAMKVFQCLTERGSDNRETRRPTRLEDICTIVDIDVSAVRKVIEVFRATGRAFLTPGISAELVGNSIIDISHESLTRKWNRLREWVDKESQARQIYVRLAEAARFHKEGTGALWGNPELQLAREWRQEVHPNAAWAGRYHPGYEEAIKFLQESEITFEREKRAEASRQKRARYFAYTLATVALIVLAAVFSLYRKAEAQTRIALARSLVAQVQPLLNSDPSEVEKVALLTIEAIHLQPDFGGTILGLILERLPKRISTFKPDGDNLAGFVAAGGRFVASLRREDAKIYDTGSWREVSTVDMVSNPTGFDLSSDGRFVAWGEVSGAELVDLQSHKAVVTIQAPAPGSQVAISPDGKWFAATVASHAFTTFEDTTLYDTVQLYSLPDSSKRQEIRLKHSASHVVFSTDSRYLAAEGTFRDKSFVEISSIDGLKDRIVDLAKPPMSFALGPGGKLLAELESDKTLRIWSNDKTDEQQYALGPEESFDGNAIAFSRDGRFLVVDGLDGTARVFDTSSHQHVSSIPVGVIVSASFDDAGHIVMASTGGQFSVSEIFNSSSFDPLSFLSSETIIHMMEGSRLLVAGMFDDGLRIVQRDSGKETWKPPAGTYSGAEASEDGSHVALFNTDGSFVVYDTQSGGSVLKLPKSAVSDAGRFSLNPDGSRLAWAAGTSITVASTTTAEPNRSLPIAEEGKFAMSPNATRLAETGDNFVQVLDVSSGKELYRVKSNSMAASGLKFSPDGRFLAITWGPAGLFQLVDAESGKELWTARPGQTYGITFNHKSAMVAVSSSSMVKILSTQDGTVTTLLDGTENLPIQQVIFSPDDTYIEINQDFSIRRFFLNTSQRVDLACSVLTRNLTAAEWKQYMVGMDYHKTCPNLP